MTSTPGSPSVRAAGSAFASYRSGSARFTRPRQLDPSLLAQLDGGLDPQEVSQVAHATAAALLDHVRHTQDPQVVSRVLHLVEEEGLDLIAELWSQADSDSLAGILWRLYTMRLWMRRNGQTISRLWRLEEPRETAASAIAGIDADPTPDDIASTADSILAGAFTGDFAVALERSGAFCEVISSALARLSQREGAGRQGQALARTARNLAATSRAFTQGAKAWREGGLY